jgi:hypothetical protein
MTKGTIIERPLSCLLQRATNRTMDVMFASSKSRVAARVLVEHLLLPTMCGILSWLVDDVRGMECS